jgi:hypothetical protein
MIKRIIGYGLIVLVFWAGLLYIEGLVAGLFGQTLNVPGYSELVFIAGLVIVFYGLMAKPKRVQAVK